MQKKKRTKLLVALFLLLISSNILFAQTSQKIDISLNNAPLKEFFSTIEKKTGYTFIYNNIDLNQKVSVDKKQTSLQEVLSQVLSDKNIVFEVEGNHVILKTKIATSSAKPAQAPRAITGVVADQSGEPLIGVSITIKGSTIGTITDVDGRFAINAADNQQLVISYVGYTSKNVEIKANTSSLDIVLNENNVTLGAVVVTALGIKRESKTLTYNVQEIKTDQLTTVKDANFINSLAGKIAGVTINQSSSGIGGSARVVMRGVKSLFGENNALYVIDGIPVTNMKTAQTDSYYDVPDGGDSDGISSINPEDIESMSVLTGAAAAALYGAQGANGVILINTKKGVAGKVKVSYSNDTQFMSPFVMPKFQNTYGSPTGEFSSWGGKLDTPTNYDPKDFFQTGYSETNAVTLSGGTDQNQTYFSAASTNARGIIPNNTYNRYNFTFRNTTVLLKDKLTLDANISYIMSNNNNMMTQGQYHNPLIPIYLFPRGDDIEKYKVYERYNVDRNFPTQFWTYGVQDLSMENPYWIVNRENFGNNKQRYMFSPSLRYKVLDWLNITGRLRVDNSEDTYERKISASSSTLFASEAGNYLNMRTQYKNTYGDAIATIDKRFTKWSLNANMGGSFTDGVNNITGYEGHLLSVPNLFTFSNIDKSGADTHDIQDGYHESNQAVFTTLQLGYGNFVFLDLTGRNDWYSSLAFTDNEKSGFFYPSVGVSYVATELMDLSKYKVSFFKVRGSYSEVGNAPMRFLTSTTYKLENGTPQNLPSVPPTFLKPERTKSFEVGLNLRMFDGKLNLDMTYYNSNTYNQFFTFTMPPSSGYKNFYLNGGKVNNWGIEGSLGFNQKIGPVDWRSNVTFTLNRNEIKELLPSDAKNPITGEPMTVTEIEPFEAQGSYKMILKKGGSLSDIYVSGLKTDENGYIHINAQTGAIQADVNNWMKAGSAAPRFNWGFSNSFSWNGIHVSGLVTARIGGVGVSATQALLDRHGASQASADARDNGGVVVNNGLLGAADYYKVVGGGPTGVLSQYVYSATNVRLQEVSLGYSLPKKWINGVFSNVSLSLIGKNLVMFHNKAPFDPELSASTSTYYQGFDYFMQPSLRSLGFGVKIDF